MAKRSKGARIPAVIRQAIQDSRESIRTLAKRYGIDPKTVARWRTRSSVVSRKTGPRSSASSVLTPGEEAMIVAFREETQLPLDACLKALRARVPHLTRSSLHRCLKRHGVSRSPAAPSVNGSAGARGTRGTALRPNGVGVGRKRRSRDPAGTREAILQAARISLAEDGPDGLSLSEVARIAGVNRGTAYQHFRTRDSLAKATAQWVSDRLFRAVFGDPKILGKRRVEQVDVAELIDHLSNFAIENPELCRAWLLQVLSSEDPASDIFWREYQGSTESFARTEFAQDNIDTEVLSVIMLAGAFLWPVLARSKARSRKELKGLADRFAQECLRISMYGNLRSERYPKIAERLKANSCKTAE